MIRLIVPRNIEVPSRIRSGTAALLAMAGEIKRQWVAT
jgi:hypothetical protein